MSVEGGRQLIALAGLPGTGKSTLARALGAALSAPIFDKDAVRAALFTPDAIDYSREQDDLCWELTLRAAELELARRDGPDGRSLDAAAARTEFPQCGNSVGVSGAGPGLPACVILDGRTYCRSGQVDALRHYVAQAGLPLLLVECVCSAASACARLAADVAARRHLAANRDAGLYQKLAEAAIAIAPPKLEIDTDRLPLAEQVATVLAALAPARPAE